MAKAIPCITSTPPLLDEPPPPYALSTVTSALPSFTPPPTNPGFCPSAYHERLANQQPGGGMVASQYFQACKTCNVVCGDEISPQYKLGWLDWVDPSLNFRWESHVCSGKGDEMLGCWLCWEYEQKWTGPMEVVQWYRHMRRHFFVEGYRICKGKTGGMQRRRNCGVARCPKIHS